MAEAVIDGPDPNEESSKQQPKDGEAEATLVVDCPDVFERLKFTDVEIELLNALDIVDGGETLLFLEKACEVTDGIASYLTEINCGEVDEDDDSLPDYSGLVDEQVDLATKLPQSLASLDIKGEDAARLITSMILRDIAEKIKVLNLAFDTDCFEVEDVDDVILVVTYALVEHDKVDEQGVIIGTLVGTAINELMDHMQEHIAGVQQQKDKQTLSDIAEIVFSERNKTALQRLGSHVLDTVKLAAGVSAGIFIGLEVFRQISRRR